MPTPFPVALDYAHAGATVAPSDRELAEAGAMIVSAERRKGAAVKAGDDARKDLSRFYWVNVVLGVGVGLWGGLQDGGPSEPQIALLLGVLALVGATYVAGAAIIPGERMELYAPEELARLLGYVTVADGCMVTTPLGVRAVKAYEAWPKPLDPPVTVEEAAWKPLR